jgi:hypothetical protein
MTKLSTAVATFWRGELSEKTMSLIQDAGKNDDNGEARRASAELEARSSLSLTQATKVLAFATLGLVIATLVLVFVTFFK